MKSYTTIVQTACPICGNKKDTGELLLNTHLKDSFDMYTTVGYKVCDTCIDTPDVVYILSATETGELTGSYIKTTKDSFNVPVEGNVAFMLPKEFNQLIKD